MTERITCPCCGHMTLLEGPGAYDWCRVCDWEDDGARTDAESIDGPNGVTLAEGQRRYRMYGASALHRVGHTRLPRDDEPLDPTWRPRPVPDDFDAHRACLEDLGWLLEIKATQARDAARSSRSDSDLGRAAAMREVVELLIEQAHRFDLPPLDLGLEPDYDVDRYLALDPPKGYYAG